MKYIKRLNFSQIMRTAILLIAIIGGFNTTSAIEKGSIYNLAALMVIYITLVDIDKKLKG